MNDCNVDAGRLESALSVVMRGMHGSLAENPFAHLPIAQLRLLRSLSDGPQTPSALSETLSTTVSAVTQLANRLVTAKLVEREEDPRDRRVRRLKLSDLGRKLIVRRKEMRVARAGRLLEGLSDEDRESIIHVVERLAAITASVAPAGGDSLALVAELEGTEAKS